MRRLITILSVAVICGALSCPTADARGRNNNGGGGNTTQQTTNNRGNTPARVESNRTNKNSGAGRPGNNGAVTTTRPGNNQGRPGNGGNNQGQGRPGNGGGQVTPGNGGNNQGQGRPGNGGSQVTPGNGGNNQGQGRPGNNNVRPGNTGGNHNGNHGGSGPGPNYGAPNHGNAAPGYGPNNGGHAPGHAPGHGPGYGPGGHGAPGRPGSVAAIPNRRPDRPYMMQHHHPFARPVPPPAFRPGPRYPTIRTILGVAIGSAINMSLNYLFDAGYYVTGYTNNAVYINDVVQLNMLWPNATLFYNGGMLVGSEFVYSTPYYDTNRYYSAYNALTNAYGLPVVRNNIPGGYNCSWFGYDGNYVTLQFQSGVAVNGTNRYYTTLSFGN